VGWVGLSTLDMRWMPWVEGLFTSVGVWRLAFLGLCIWTLGMAMRRSYWQRFACIRSEDFN
jgi:hypothetical protein